jgi:hypothetical protein
MYQIGDHYKSGAAARDGIQLAGRKTILSAGRALIKPAGRAIWGATHIRGPVGEGASALWLLPKAVQVRRHHLKAGCELHPHLGRLELQPGTRHGSNKCAQVHICGSMPC